MTAVLTGILTGRNVVSSAVGSFQPSYRLRIIDATTFLMGPRLDLVRLGQWHYTRQSFSHMTVDKERA